MCILSQVIIHKSKNFWIKNMNQIRNQWRIQKVRLSKLMFLNKFKKLNEIISPEISIKY